MPFLDNDSRSNIQHLDKNVYLSDLSQRDKVWDKHRHNSDTVADFYRNTDEYNSYANRIDFCSQVLEFQLTEDNTKNNRIVFKLLNSRFCRVRNCPICQWRRSLMWKAKALQILPKIVGDYPNYRWLFITLTVKNCSIKELRGTLHHMNKSWRRLIQRKKFPAIGWLRSTEITKSKNNLAHPHFHCLLLVPSSYFGANYIKQNEWMKLWQKCLRVDYDPVVDIRAIKKGQDPTVLIPEILKYAVKESDLVDDREWFLEFTKQIHKMRFVSTGGVLKDYFKFLEQEPEDLIGHDEENMEASDEDLNLFFKWQKPEQSYKLWDI